MTNFIKSIFIIFLLITFQIGMHKLAIKPDVSQWGATDAEAAAPLPNDDKADFIVATRAITIDKPLDETWAWINQLGADRSGFFSFYFIERAMGYYTRERDVITPDSPEFKIGDVVRGSISPETSLFLYEFPVIDVKSNDYFTMDNWGTFKLIRINDNQTRLIIRTHGKDRGGLIANAVDYVAYALHFIMERATLQGFKQRIEFGEGTKFSTIEDLLWFSFVVISGLLIGLYVFILRGLKAIFIPLIFSTLWLFSTFIAPANPIFSGMLTVFLLLLLWFKSRLTTNI